MRQNNNKYINSSSGSGDNNCGGLNSRNQCCGPGQILMIMMSCHSLSSLQVTLGGECWSSANGVASGGCAPGTQCGPWLPNGGTWDGTSAWYCLATPKLASGAACDYSDAIKVKKSNNLCFLKVCAYRWVSATLG